MKRIIRSCLIKFGICLVFFGCHRSTALPSTDVFNEAKEANRIPTLADNMAAYVVVYCFWRNPTDGETIWDTMSGVVLDQVHVLTTRCDDMSDMTGWEGAHMDPLTVGPYDDENESGHGPWEARQVTKDTENSDLVIVAASSPLPVPSVVFGVKAPKLGEVLYTVVPTEEDANISEIEVLVTAVFEKGKSRSWSAEIDFAVILPTKVPCCYISPISVFNQQHEFVGFMVGSYSSVITIQNLPPKFAGKNILTMGYDFAGMRNGLKSLLRQAGVNWPDQPRRRAK